MQKPKSRLMFVLFLTLSVLTSMAAYAAEKVTVRFNGVSDYLVDEYLYADFEIKANSWGFYPLTALYSKVDRTIKNKTQPYTLKNSADLYLDSVTGDIYLGTFSKRVRVATSTRDDSDKTMTTRSHARVATLTRNILLNARTYKLAFRNAGESSIIVPNAGEFKSTGYLWSTDGLIYFHFGFEGDLPENIMPLASTNGYDTGLPFSRLFGKIKIDLGDSTKRLYLDVETGDIFIGDKSYSETAAKEVVGYSPVIKINQTQVFNFSTRMTDFAGFKITVPLAYVESTKTLSIGKSVCDLALRKYPNSAVVGKPHESFESR